MKKVCDLMMGCSIGKTMKFCVSSIFIVSNLSGAPRPPFDNLIEKLVHLNNYKQRQQKSPVIVSVDIPSGWHVEEGDVNGEGIKPDMLVRLSCSLSCALETYVLLLFKHE